MNVNNDHFLDREKLEQLLEKAIASSHNYKIMIDSFYKELNGIVRDTYQQEWNCTHFLGLLAGFSFYDYCRKEYERTHKKIDESIITQNKNYYQQITVPDTEIVYHYVSFYDKNDISKQIIDNKLLKKLQPILEGTAGCNSNLCIQNTIYRIGDSGPITQLAFKTQEAAYKLINIFKKKVLTRKNISSTDLHKLALKGTLKFFDKLTKNYLCHEYKTPIAWLYQAILFKQYKTLIAFLRKAYNNIKIAILSVKYDLQINFSLELEHKCISLNINCLNEDKTNIIYNVEQATDFLNKKLNEIYKPHNIIKLCLNSEVFHVYLHRSKYQVYETTGSSLTSLCHRDHLDDIITNANIYNSYPYPYSSLLKISKHDTNSKATLETLASGDNIHLSENNNNLWCNFEDSLFEKICEKSKCLALSATHIITLADIFFRQEELQEYVKQVKNGFSDDSQFNHINEKALPVKKKQHELHKVINYTYNQLKIELDREPTNNQVWEALTDQKNRPASNLKYDPDTVISVITREKIEWTNHHGDRRRIARKTFDNLLSKLRHPKK